MPVLLGHAERVQEELGFCYGCLGLCDLLQVPISIIDLETLLLSALGNVVTVMLAVIVMSLPFPLIISDWTNSI